jgi:6-phosphofructokinase 1
MKPLPFEELRDPKTGRPRVRMVDVEGESYEVARQYMMRLEKKDLEDPERLEKLAATAKMTPAEFVKKFEYIA